MNLRPKFVCASLLLAAMVIAGSCTTAFAQTADRVDPLEPKNPPFAKNVLFVEDSSDPVPFYLVSNLRNIDILGKPAIGGNFYVFDDGSSGTIVVIPTETNNEFWFLSSSGSWGLITVKPAGHIDWVDPKRNSGFIILF